MISREVEAERVNAKVFYLADYQPVDVKQWADTIAVAFGNRGTYEAPFFFMRLAAATGDILKRIGIRNPPLTSTRLNNLLTDAVFEMEPVRSLCGETPFTLETGVRTTVEWMRRPESLHTKVLPVDASSQS